MLIKFLLPVLLSITSVGGIGTIIGYYYLRTELETINNKLLEATLNNTELILSEMDSLMLAFEIHPSIINKCYHILNAQTFGYTEYQDLRSIETYINAPVNARQYIDSIYVYYPNPYDRFIKSNDRSGILGNGFTEGWYESYLEHWDVDDTWSEKRVMLTSGKEVISIYQMLDHKGLIVLNLDAKYLGEIMKSAQAFAEQSIYILNSKNEPILQIGNEYDESAIRQADDVTFRMYSKRYRWSYISVIPRGVFYHIPILIIRYTIMILLLVSLAGIILAYISTKHNYRQFKKLQDIIDAACKGRKTKEQPIKESSDYFGHLTQQLIQNFVEQDFLKIQYSERKYKLRSMELMAMQSQMNPHFLYNTLETIGWKIMGIAGGRTEANAMLENLSEVLIYSLDSEHEYALLEEEIQVTKSYVRIMQGRYGNQFFVRWDCEEAALQETIVKFVLQPLIENALNHGIRETERETGKIKVRIHIRAQMLCIHVLDNGVGIEKDRLEILRQGLEEDTANSTHIGIFNTNRRLKLAYGEEFGMRIQSRAGEGTIVSIRIPMSGDEVQKSIKEC